jgi:ankyrin repeat protein
MAADPAKASYDREGLHPLALAAALGRLACMDSLFKAGAEADFPDRKGLTALYWARHFDQALAEAVLVDNGASREAWPILVD